jgi:hypothetical protein
MNFTRQNNGPIGRCRVGGVLALMMLAAAACSPEVKIQAPDKPIVINLNVKIEQEVRIKIEKDIDDLFRENKDLF